MVFVSAYTKSLWLAASVCSCLLFVSTSAEAGPQEAEQVPTNTPAAKQLPKRVHSFSKHLDTHLRAIKTYEEAEDTPAVIQHMLRASVMYRLQGDPNTALDFILAASDLHDSYPDSGIYYQIQSQLTEFCQYAGNYELAQKYAEKSLAYFIRTKDSLGQYNEHFRIGNSLRMQGCYADALQHYAKAKALRDAIKRLRPKPLYTLPEVAKAYMCMDNHQPAIGIFRKVLRRVARDSAVTFSLSDSYLNMAECLMRMSDFDSAHYYATHGLQLAKELGNIHHEKEYNRILNQVYAHQRDFDKAHAALHRYNSLLTLTQGAAVGSMLIETVLDWKLQATRAQMAVLQTRTEVAFLVQEKNRNRLFFLALLSACVLLTVLVATWLWALKKRYHTLKLKGKMLAMRMNPHFIGNLLMAVQDALYEQTPDRIETYLSNTAAHIRHTLERSYDDWTPLTEELEELERYVQLQKLRFGSKFVYRVQLDASIPICELSLPPFLIQPLLENAIEYGVRYQKSEISKVLLKLEADSEKTIKCTLVNDCSTERTVPDPKRNKRSLSHKIIQERLSLYQMRSKLRPIRLEKVGSVTEVSLLIPTKHSPQNTKP